jgi:hypothetical protein
MKQSVNLYLPEFRRKQEWLDALRMVQATGVLLLLVALGYGWETWQLANANADLVQAEARRNAAVAATAELRASFGVQAPDQSVLDQNQQLEDALKEKRAILEFMRGNDLGNTGGFSEFLADLARYHVQGLSLKEISISRDGKSVTLSGEVARAELVPIYLQNLNRGAAFRGLEFAALQIKEAAAPAAGSAQQSLFAFTVSTAR